MEGGSSETFKQMPNEWAFVEQTLIADSGVRFNSWRYGAELNPQVHSNFCGASERSPVASLCVE